MLTTQIVVHLALGGWVGLVLQNGDGGVEVVYVASDSELAGKVKPGCCLERVGARVPRSADEAVEALARSTPGLPLKLRFKAEGDVVVWPKQEDTGQSVALCEELRRHENAVYVMKPRTRRVRVSLGKTGMTLRQLLRNQGHQGPATVRWPPPCDDREAPWRIDVGAADSVVLVPDAWIDLETWRAQPGR